MIENISNYTFDFPQWNLKYVTVENCLSLNNSILKENQMLRYVIFIFLVLYIIEHRQDLFKFYLWLKNHIIKMIEK